MKTTSKILLGLIVTVIGLGLLHLGLSRTRPEPDAGVPTGYRSELGGIAFATPEEGLYMKEIEREGTVNPLSIVLVENTPENVALLDGEGAEGREGPTSITVDVYENPDELPAEDWVQRDTNWTVANTSSTATTVSGQRGVTFSWSGLYEGKTVVVTKGTRAYVFAVTWMEAADRLLGDFDAILSSVSFE